MKKDMTTIQSRIILALSKTRPMQVGAIAEKVRNGNETIGRRQCEAHCAYQLELLTASGIVETGIQGKRRRIYTLAKNVELMEGEITLKDEKGNAVYIENVNNVMRFTDRDGEVYLKILA